MAQENKLTIEELYKRLEEVKKEEQEAKREKEVLETLKEYHGDDEVVSFQAYKELLEEKSNLVWQVKSKFPTSDKMIEGFQGGDLVVITGPTGQGKTAFCQTLTKNFTSQGVKCLWFSYEVPARQFLAKFGDELPIGYMPKALIDKKLVWIESKIVEAIAKFGVKVVFLDHLHYLLDLSVIRNSSLEIGAIMREMKLMAKKYDIVIFIVAHMTKTKFEERVGLEDIRDSSFVAQESDYVIALWRLTEKQSKKEVREEGVKYKDEALVSVEKNRKNGQVGTFRVIFKDNMFQELADYGEVPV